MLDILVPQVVLQGSGIVASVGQGEAAGMSEHVRMHLERHPRYLALPLDKVVEADGCERSASLGDEHMASGVLTPQSP